MRDSVRLPPGKVRDRAWRNQHRARAPPTCLSTKRGCPGRQSGGQRYPCAGHRNDADRRHRATSVDSITKWLTVIATTAANCCHSGIFSQLPQRESGDVMAAKVHLFLCLQDNFGLLVHDPASGATAAIDAPEATAVEAALKETGWK